MQQVVKRLRERGGFEVAYLTMQAAWNEASAGEVLSLLTRQLAHQFGREFPTPSRWADLQELFGPENFGRPLVLVLDEFDALSEEHIRAFANVFRDMYIRRLSESDRASGEKSCLLHGLALVGVRAVLGVESTTGSPFNVQQSVRVPNLTPEEVEELYRQYQDESGQQVAPEVVEQVYLVTRGQPGLVSWFGELLTERYNPGVGAEIGLDEWRLVWHKARFAEPNNTVLNIISKARMPEYREFLIRLFGREDVGFSFHNPVHNYLYMHGVIEPETVRPPGGEWVEVCRFTSPFVQSCLYDALGMDLLGDRLPLLALEPLDDLGDVFAGDGLNLTRLLERYRGYLKRLKEQGLNPWREQPRRRSDLHLTEAVGHFHLYFWLQEAVGGRCVVSPEFPTGNGRVDLYLRCGRREGIIEVKSFVDVYRAREDRKQAARYARKMGLETVTLALFVPVEDEEVLDKLSGEEEIDGVKVSVVAVGWE
jgi:hypothetical protein